MNGISVGRIGADQLTDSLLRRTKVEDRGSSVMFYYVVIVLVSLYFIVFFVVLVSLCFIMFEFSFTVFVLV